MSGDTLDEAFQASSGHITNHHAPILVAAWSVLWHVSVGPGWLFAGQLLGFVAGCYLILRSVFRPLTSAIVTAAISFFPPVFGLLAWVGRDMWYLSFVLLAFGCLVRAVQRPWPVRGRWLAGSVGAAWLALAARQNAAATVVIVMVGVAGLLLARRWAEPAAARAHSLRRSALVLAAGVALTLGLMATQAGLGAVIGVQNTHPERFLLIYDLGALSKEEHKDLFPASVLPPSKLPQLERSFNVDDVIGITYAPGAPVPVVLSDAQNKALRDRWIAEVTGDPLEYLGMRWRLFLRQINITRRPIWVFHPVIDPNSFGYVTRFPKLDDAASDYVTAFAEPNLDGTIIHRAWIYLLIAAVAAALLLRRTRGPVLWVIGGVALAALTTQIAFFFGAMGVQFRFEHAPIVFTLLAGAVLAKLAVARLARRPQGPRVAQTR
jgi:hypothetical protein